MKILIRETHEYTQHKRESFSCFCKWYGERFKNYYVKKIIELSSPEKREKNN